MTPDERSTERIRTWLADTADELGDPTRGVNDVIVRLSATPQRRRWRAWPWARGASSTEQLGGDHLATHGRSSGRLGLAGLAILVAGIGAGLGAGSVLVQQREPRTIVVAQDGSGDATTIGGAMAMAVDGDTVLVWPGRYVERITMEADITIRGYGNRGDIIIEAPDVPGSRHDGTPVSVAVTIRGSFGTLANLTILGGDQGGGISVEDAAAPEISDVVINSTGDPMYGTAAVNWSGGGSGVLHDSSVSGVLRMTGAGTTPLIEWNHLRGACIVVEADGGARDDQPRPVFRENEINGCAAGTLVRIEAGLPVLEHNDLVLAGGTALLLSAGVSGARVEGNTIHDSGTAIAIAHPRGPVTLTDNILRGDAVGISVYDGSDQVRIEGNEIRDGGIGLNLVGGTDPVASGNVLCDNAEDVRVLPASREVPAVDGAETCPEASPAPGA